MSNVDQLCVNALRFLSAEAVQAANSGHPGLPLGAAPMAYALWDRVLRHNPANPKWFNRDRFILSAGHGSALLYSLLHMTGYDLPIEEIKNFRQWESKTPGHPEFGHTPGVEATTGPLGQGFSMGVGMAMAERFLAAKFNTPECNVVDHYTYAIVSDGDLMEGVASEAASLAATQKLGKLIYLYDDNEISIEGSTDLAFTECVATRFEGYGWQVLSVEDGNDVDAIEAAVLEAQKDTERPSIIAIKTIIGYGSPKAGTAKAHGEPLGAEALAATKEALGWPAEPAFYVPDEAYDHMRKALDAGAAAEADWSALVEKFAAENAELAAAFNLCVNDELPEDWDANIPVFDAADATRSSSGKALNAIAKRVPNLIGGSADLAPSNKTDIDNSEAACAETPGGRKIHFGVREHAMAAALNGMALHGGVIPFGGTFLVFADYMRGALRLAALMQTHVTYVLTHDSIGVGEDGPTHQPIETVASLRSIPGFTVLRPADPNETAAAWRVAMERRGPVALALTRQKLPVIDPNSCPLNEGVARGAYIVADVDSPDIILIGTGSEVQHCVAAQSALAEKGVNARVVSMPSWELFEEQPCEYKKSVLAPSVPKLAIEAGISMGWHKYVGCDGAIIALDHFGASAPGDLVMEKFGFTAENVTAKALELLQK